MRGKGESFRKQLDILPEKKNVLLPLLIYFITYAQGFNINRLKLASFNMIPTNDIYILLINEGQHRTVASD